MQLGVDYSNKLYITLYFNRSVSSYEIASGYAADPDHTNAVAIDQTLLPLTTAL